MGLLVVGGGAVGEKRGGGWGGYGGGNKIKTTRRATTRHILGKSSAIKRILCGEDCALECGLGDLHDNDGVSEAHLIPRLVKYLSLQPTPPPTIRPICYSMDYKRVYYGIYCRGKCVQAPSVHGSHS